MMALAAVNVLGAVVFAGIYAASGTGRLPPAAFLVGLPVAFIAITTSARARSTRWSGSGEARSASWRS